MEPEYERYFRWVEPGAHHAGAVRARRGCSSAARCAALRTRTLHMDLPIAVALRPGFTRGAVNTVTGHGPDLLRRRSRTLIFLLLVGRFLQQRAQRAATDSAELLYSLSPVGRARGRRGRRARGAGRGAAARHGARGARRRHARRRRRR